MGTFSANLLLSEPTPFDPAVANAWGTILNTDLSLIDSAVAGILTLSVAGNTDVTLTSNQGAADQARNQHFVFTGALTGSINVFWPASRNRFFSVKNATSGAFSLTCAVVGTPGTTVAVPQGATVLLKSDGTNISQRFDTFTTQLGVVSGGTGLNTLTAHGVLIGAGTSAINVTGAGTTGQVLTSNGASADPTFQNVTGGVSSIADATNGGLNFSASTGAVTANLLPSDLLTKAAPISADSFMIMDSAASSVAKTALLSSLAASSAATFTGTDTTKWITPGGFGGNLSNTNPGYIKLPGGLIIQWGVVTAVPISGTKTQALAVAFPNECYSIVASYQSTSAPANAAGATCTTTTVTAQNQSSGSAFDIAWIAFGH